MKAFRYNIIDYSYIRNIDNLEWIGISPNFGIFVRTFCKYHKVTGCTINVATYPFKGSKIVHLIHRDHVYLICEAQLLKFFKQKSYLYFNHLGLCTNTMNRYFNNIKDYDPFVYVRIDTEFNYSYSNDTNNY